MTEKERAAQNLETIRSMMQRATVYRMISGPTALFAGFIALLLGGSPSMGVLFLPFKLGWYQKWLVILAAVVVFNTILVVRKAAKEKTAVMSPGLKMALKAILPALIVAGIVGIQVEGYSEGWITVRIWAVGYGLALMATGSFAPKSMWWLGFFFILAATIPSFSNARYFLPRDGDLFMAMTFGCFHIIYGLYVAVFENKRS